MIEAQPINKGYAVINLFAKEVDSKTSVSKLYELEDVIIPMGGKINFVRGDKIDSSKFVQILGPNNFEVTLIDGLDKSFKRLLLIQALGHYMLHGDSGLRVCCISSASKSAASQEGLWFSLSTLIPDETFLNVYNNFDTKGLANLFRVPEFAIEAKRKIITKVYLNKEEI
jgi:Zn-dependent peptidase ImmA (M78 family)